MQKILGLDIGSYSIKAIEIINTFKTYKVNSFYEKVIPEIENLDPSTVGLTAVRQLFTENEVDPDRTYTAMMGLLVSLRVLNLQNAKKRNVPMIVEGQLEDQAPFPLEEAVIDQQILDIKDGNTSVLAVLSRKDHVEAYLNGLKDLGIEPKIIDVDYLAFMNLYPFLLTEEEDETLPNDHPAKGKKGPPTAKGCKLILDIGHMKTSMVLFNDGKFVAARTIRMGGRYFTDYLAKSLGITYNEAQRVKHAISRIEHKTTTQPKPGSEREFLVARKLAIAVSELVKELVRTLFSFKAHEKMFPECILLTGGSSALLNLPEYLEESLEVPVRRMKFDNTRLKIEDERLAQSPIIAQALAIGLRGVPGKHQSQINLRRGELAFVGSYDAIIRQAANVSLLVASLLVCLVASYGFRWWLYGRQTDEFKKRYREQVIQLLGTEPKALKNMAASSSWDLKAYSGQAMKIIQEDVKLREQILETFAKKQSAAPLRVLNEVSQAIPKDISIDVTNFSVQGNTVVLEGETDSYASSEKIQTLLKNVPSFASVERKSQEYKPGSDNKIVKFTVSAQLKEGT